MKTYIRRKKLSKGLTSVELLVTIFVAVMFLASGYALYLAIVTQSAGVRHRAQADNIAYDYLRRYESTVTNPCIASTPVNNVTLTEDSAIGLPTPTVTVAITCPNSSVTSVSNVTVTVGYTDRGTARSVRQEIYASAN